jgi:hypothetical protein
MMFSTTSICHKFNGICSCIVSEEKKRDDYICYCPDEDILGLGDRGLVKEFIAIDEAQARRRLPRLRKHTSPALYSYSSRPGINTYAEATID